MSAYKDLLERYVEVYNKGDLDACAEFYAEDAVQIMPDGTYTGRDAIRSRLAVELAGMPDTRYTVTRFLEEGETFADEFTVTGTHTAPLQLPDGTQLPPTGKRVEIRGMEFVEMRNGKIVIDNLYYDNLAVLAQLGLIPQPATA